MVLIIASLSSALGPSGNPLFDDSHIWISFNVVVCRWKLAWNLQGSYKTLHSCAIANSSWVLQDLCKMLGRRIVASCWLRTGTPATDPDSVIDNGPCRLEVSWTSLNFCLRFALAFYGKAHGSNEALSAKINKTTTIKHNNNNNKTSRLVPRATMLLVAEDLHASVRHRVIADKRLLISPPCLSKTALQSSLENSPNYKPGF